MVGMVPRATDRSWNDQAVSDVARVSVIEPPLPERVRRPIDLLRFVVGIFAIVAVALIATVATDTSNGLQHDVVQVTSGLPHAIITLVAFVGNIGVLLLPFAIAVDLVIRRRIDQLLTAVLAVVITLSVSLLIIAWITKTEPWRLQEVFTQTLSNGEQSTAIEPVLASVISYLTIANPAGRRRWWWTSFIIIVSVAVTEVLGGRITFVAIVESLLLGWVIGVGLRAGLGASSTRPAGAEVASALNAAGMDISSLTYVEASLSDGRVYRAERPAKAPLVVHVLDRDLTGAGWIRRLWRRLRVVSRVAQGPRLSLRAAVEHEALVAMSITTAGVSARRVRAVSEVGPYAALIAYEVAPGQSLAAMTKDDATPIDDEVLVGTWQMHRALERARIAHRGLTADMIELGEDGKVRVVPRTAGEVAATDLQLRLDTVQLLAQMSLLVGTDRTLATARSVLGTRRVAETLPLLQRIALSSETRRAVRGGDRDLMKALRTQISETIPTAPTEQTQLRRVSWRSIITIVGGSVALYFLLAQLSTSQVPLPTLLREADPRWVISLLVLSGLTYVGAAMSVVGFVPEKVSYLRAMAAQFAASFANLLAPSSVGAVTVNARFLQRSGVDPPLAVASVGLSQVVAFIIHLIMLVIFAVIARTIPQHSLTPSPVAIIVFAAIVMIAGGFLISPFGRRLIQERIRPLFNRVIPRLVEVVQRPSKLAFGLGGNLLLNLSYIFALVAAIRAFGGTLGVASIAVVYLAGSAIGSVVPTPGGLGAVESALAAGLSAAGLGGGIAIYAVLLFRLATFWLPVAPGWFSFNVMQKRGYL
jgi:glycosyltransferase 2 family protein